MEKHSQLRKALEEPPLKRIKIGKTDEKGTLTDQDILGPCEPGTAINLEGIVANETKGGLLSLNITWRGKSFLGTLLDCSTVSPHAGQWAPPWIADEEAPNLKPKCYYNKHYMRRKMKKKKRKKNVLNAEKNNSPVIMKNFSQDDTVNIKETTVMKTRIVDPPSVKYVKCKSENCKKKFTSRSALQYHVSSAHGNIPQQIKLTIDTNEPFMDKTKDNKDVIYKTNLAEKKEEKIKIFPSIQNIRPIVPVQAPKLAGLSVRPIQPKPMLLPGLSATMNTEGKLNHKSMSSEQQKNMHQSMGCPTKLNSSYKKEENSLVSMKYSGFYPN